MRLEEVYFLPGNKVQNHHGGMVLLGDHIYIGNGHNNGFPMCLEFESGKVTWAPGRGPGTGSAAVLEADGKLYFRYQNGMMALIDADPHKYVVKGRFMLASHNSESWPHPVIVDGRLYLAIKMRSCATTSASTDRAELSERGSFAADFSAGPATHFVAKGNRPTKPVHGRMAATIGMRQTGP